MGLAFHLPRRSLNDFGVWGDTVSFVIFTLSSRVHRSCVAYEVLPGAGGRADFFLYGAKKRGGGIISPLN